MLSQSTASSAPETSEASSPRGHQSLSLVCEHLDANLVLIMDTHIGGSTARESGAGARSPGQ